MSIFDTIKRWVGFASVPQQPEPAIGQAIENSANNSAPVPEAKRLIVELPNGRIAEVDEHGNFQGFVDSSVRADPLRRF